MKFKALKSQFFAGNFPAKAGAASHVCFYGVRREFLAGPDIMC
jgi:hypothetical protein